MNSEVGGGGKCGDFMSTLQSAPALWREAIFRRKQKGDDKGIARKRAQKSRPEQKHKEEGRKGSTETAAKGQG